MYFTYERHGTVPEATQDYGRCDAPCVPQVRVETPVFVDRPVEVVKYLPGEIIIKEVERLVREVGHNSHELAITRARNHTRSQSCELTITRAHNIARRATAWRTVPPTALLPTALPPAAPHRLSRRPLAAPPACRATRLPRRPLAALRRHLPLRRGR